MWFDIIRKKVVSIQVVIDIMHHLNGVFYYAKSLFREKNSKFKDAFSTYVYIRDNMLEKVWDDGEEKFLPRVKEMEAYVEKFEEVLRGLTEWYNSIPKETKRRSGNLFRQINKELNAAHSLFLDSDFVFRNNRRVYGTYYPRTDTSTLNVPAFADITHDEEWLIESISDTLSHEFGHQASRSIDSPTLGDDFYEEMLAYLVQYHDDKQLAFESWLRHPAVTESMQKDKSGRKKILYDDIKMAIESGIIGNKKNNKLYNDIIQQLHSVMDLQTNPAHSIQYN